MSNALLSFDKHQALVVDDDSVACTVAKRTLTRMGFDVIVADDGDTALTLLESHNPDLILLDVEMERMNGIDACRKIRANASFGDKPILMMTSHDDADSIDRAFEAGATDFVTKPVNWTLLNHKIKYVMRSQEVLFELLNAEQLSHMGNWRKSIDNEDIYISSGLALVLGVGKEQKVELMHYVHPLDRDRYAQKLNELRTNGSMALVHRMVCANGRELIVDHRAQVFKSYNNEPKGVLGSIQDITEKEKINRRIHQLAYFDKVTCFFNRTAVAERLEFLINSSIEQHASFVLIHIDIDNFKRINDSLGSNIGDKLLNAVAQRLNSVLIEEGYELPTKYTTIEEVTEHSNLNMLARLGADEFAVILVDKWTKAGAENIARKLVAAMHYQYTIDIRNLSISSSVGVAVYPEHGATVESLCQNTDTALHSVKRLGKNNFKVYDSILSDVLHQRMLLEEQLRLALDKNELTLYYQPQISIADLKVVGAEALIRWNSEQIGFVPPADFIPIAEETGLIAPIGNWVLRTACEQLAEWNRESKLLSRMAINISIKQFNQDDFVGQVARIIQNTDVNPGDLELELTESMLAVDVPDAIAKLKGLKSLGVEISVDDFGTGYSSLSYLKKFPIDRLKIDQSFVKDIDRDENDVAITKSIIGLARGLSLSVIAEGVETDEHLAKLTELGCDEAQGYLIAKPVPSDKFVEWMEKYQNLLSSNSMTKAA